MRGAKWHGKYVRGKGRGHGGNSPQMEERRGKKIMEECGVKWRCLTEGEEEKEYGEGT